MLDVIYYVMLNCELVSRAKLCLVNVFLDIVKDYPKMRNLPKIFLRSYENAGLGSNLRSTLNLVQLI